ncbi:hypothetical protein OUZ56_026066 [Daphnia magna]|uniref:Uncharacterized protein n=1 Tax=Daphnia magna TaxID=35525 RepID=A0ABQ9ZKT4_9CRUS|nr:hypothetical protein OUZ56_026066 [Daphnia magna]
MNFYSLVPIPYQESKLIPLYKKLLCGNKLIKRTLKLTDSVNKKLFELWNSYPEQINGKQLLKAVSEVYAESNVLNEAMCLDDEKDDIEHYPILNNFAELAFYRIGMYDSEKKQSQPIRQKPIRQTSNLPNRPYTNGTPIAFFWGGAVNPIRANRGRSLVVARTLEGHATLQMSLGSPSTYFLCDVIGRYRENCHLPELDFPLNNEIPFGVGLQSFWCKAWVVTKSALVLANFYIKHLKLLSVVV